MTTLDDRLGEIEAELAVPVPCRPDLTDADIRRAQDSVWKDRPRLHAYRLLAVVRELVKQRDVGHGDICRDLCARANDEVLLRILNGDPSE